LRLHDAVDALVTALMVDDDGRRLRTARETNVGLETASSALRGYLHAPSDQREPAADVLAEALQALFDWERGPGWDQDEFRVILYALVMADEQYAMDRPLT
jgi:hypothetical protein